MFGAIAITQNVRHHTNITHACSFERYLICIDCHLYLHLNCRCTIRFPSTNIRITFDSFVDQPLQMTNKTNKTVENSNVIYAPLKIAIPEHDKRSPFPSPTGTISAANSCPTSPRHNYHGRGDIITFDRDAFSEREHNLLSTSTYNTYSHAKNGSTNATLGGSNAALNEDFETVRNGFIQSMWIFANRFRVMNHPLQTGYVPTARISIAQRIR